MTYEHIKQQITPMIVGNSMIFFSRRIEMNHSVAPELSPGVEYQSNAFHPNSEWLETKEMWNEWVTVLSKIPADEKWASDITKAKSLYEQKRIPTFFVWENFEERDVNLVLDYIHCKLAGENV